MSKNVFNQVSLPEEGERILRAWKRTMEARIGRDITWKEFFALADTPGFADQQMQSVKSMVEKKFGRDLTWTEFTNITETVIRGWLSADRNGN
jgi:hypothetical protein